MERLKNQLLNNPSVIIAICKQSSKIKDAIVDTHKTNVLRQLNEVFNIQH
jgi:hypothetical protein